jgi:DMSO/TMAO reductase YedYZ molybdopterin-dependent catalytic subunit
MRVTTLWECEAPAEQCASRRFDIQQASRTFSRPPFPEFHPKKRSMTESTSLTIDGEVDRPAKFSRADLTALDARFQIADVSQFDPKRRGRAVKLAGLLELAGARSTAAWLTLHSSADDFHASVPLAAVRERAVLIFELDEVALPASAGGPFRFFIPDFAACHTADVDECANVKFVDRIELSRERGHDNRPADERQHAALHERESEPKSPDATS